MEKEARTMRAIVHRIGHDTALDRSQSPVCELTMNKKENQFPQFGLCLNNGGYPASLEVGKLCRVIPDDDAAVHGYIRVIDESGEGYAYTASRFHLMQLPIAVEKEEGKQ